MTLKNDGRVTLIYLETGFSVPYGGIAVLLGAAVQVAKFFGRSMMRKNPRETE